jgi:hypothetical protein
MLDRNDLITTAASIAAFLFFVGLYVAGVIT